MATDIPKILLYDEKGKHEGVAGSYCWNGICVDKGLPKSSAFNDKIIKSKDSVVSFDVEGNGEPPNFNVTIFSQNIEIVPDQEYRGKTRLKSP